MKFCIIFFQFDSFFLGLGAESLGSLNPRQLQQQKPQQRPNPHLQVAALSVGLDRPPRAQWEHRLKELEQLELEGLHREQGQLDRLELDELDLETEQEHTGIDRPSTRTPTDRTLLCKGGEALSDRTSAGFQNVLRSQNTYHGVELSFSQSIP